MRLLFRISISFYFSCLLCFAQRMPIHGITVRGNSRLAPAGIVAASGVAKGQVVVKADLNRACERLLGTGLFRSVSYGYQPKTVRNRPGIQLVLDVVEIAEYQAARLDIPGFAEQELWDVLSRESPLLTKEIPATEDAALYYGRELERVLRSRNGPARVVSRMESDLSSGKSFVVFRPANLARVGGFSFEGNASLSSTALMKALERTAITSEYTEGLFRKLLDLNIRPLYEEIGRLQVKFTVLSSEKGPSDGSVNVRVAIDEGPVYALGEARITGEDLPVQELSCALLVRKGQTANWNKISESAIKMQYLLRGKGYLTASFRSNRVFNDDAKSVDVNVHLTKGPLFRFGRLELEGLRPEVEEYARSLWRLKPNEPIDEDYVQVFARMVVRDRLAGLPKVTRELHVRPGTDIADVRVAFR